MAERPKPTLDEPTLNQPVLNQSVLAQPSLAQPSLDGRWFAKRGSIADIEQGTTFQPKFSNEGLIPAIVTDASSGVVLMFAHMNEDALRLTLETAVAHFWSRSRGQLWKKGETSGNTLRVVELRTDCDQDVIWVTADIGQNGVACHTGAKSCFYRRIDTSSGVMSEIRLTTVEPTSAGHGSGSRKGSHS